MPRSFVQLSLDERRIISRIHEKKISQAEIARTLRRDRSTICRELQRNFWHDRELQSPKDTGTLQRMEWRLTGGANIASFCVIPVCVLP
jgi:IS30 family transposase